MAFPPAPPAPPPWVTPPSAAPNKKLSHRLKYEFRSLKREKRVTSILNSGAFRNELENILRGQLEGSRQPKKTRNLHRPLDKTTASPDKPKTGPISTQAVDAVIPINDLRGVNSTKYTLAERQVRCKLAAVYRLANMFGWSQLIYNHITACAPEGEESYFVNAFGLMYHEITASNLVRVDLEGNVLDPGSTQLGINRSGFSLHSAIHSARRDIKCIIHVHTNAAIAVSSMNCGLLPISGEALRLGGVSYHDYQGDLYDDDMEEWEEIGQDLGPHNKVLILHNHGVVAMGESIEEAFHIAHMLVKACEIQVAAMTVGLNNILQVSQGVWSSHGMGVACVRGVGGATTGTIGKSVRKWRVGELEFEALMRMLDNKGYNTGYTYKGLSLLEPGVGTPRTNQRDREERMKRATRDPWSFLDNKTPRDQPISKPRHQRNSRKEPPQEFLESGGKNRGKDESHGVPSATTSADVHAGEGSFSQQNGQTFNSDVQSSRGSHPGNLSSLELAHLTAKRVAQSTGEAVKKLAMHSPMLRHTGFLEPQRLVDSDSGIIRYNKKHATHQESEQQGLGLSPIQLAQQTAEQVAESTGQAVKTLASSRHIQCSESSPETMHSNTTRNWQPSVSRTMPVNDKTASMNIRHQVGAELTHQTVESESDFSDTDTEYSTTEVTPPSASMDSSPAHYTLMMHHTPADINYAPGSSPIERVTHTAEVVADSTSTAVEKLSKSLVQ